MTSSSPVPSHKVTRELAELEARLGDLQRERRLLLGFSTPLVGLGIFMVVRLVMVLW